MSLSEHDIEKLENILFSDEFRDDSMDYFGFHGLLSATIVGPESVSQESLYQIVFGDDANRLSDADRAHFDHCCAQVRKAFKQHLLNEEAIELPYLLEQEHLEECLENWCIGFMEGFFHNEKSWFQKGEDAAAELLIPIMTLSGLFDSEDFQEILRNETLLAEFEQAIPELLTDIYLFYHGE
jgi:uncharacterized protein